LERDDKDTFILQIPFAGHETQEIRVVYSAVENENWVKKIHQNIVQQIRKCGRMGQLLVQRQDSSVNMVITLRTGRLGFDSWQA
jgi:hypothetical protein